MKKAKVSLYLDVDEVAKLRRLSKVLDSSPSRLIRRMIRQFLRRNKKVKA